MNRFSTCSANIILHKKYFRLWPI